MNLIAKISCYLDRSVVTQKIAQKIFKYSDTQYINLLWIKSWTVWYIERYSMSTYTGVTNCQKTVRFLAHPVDSYNGSVYRLQYSVATDQ